MALVLSILRKAHAKGTHHFLAIARKTETDLCGPAQRQALCTLRAEHENLREALWYFHEHSDVEHQLELASSL